jgi:hypothetical protein
MVFMKLEMYQKRTFDVRFQNGDDDPSYFSYTFW